MILHIHEYSVMSSVYGIQRIDYSWFLSLLIYDRLESLNARMSRRRMKLIQANAMRWISGRFTHSGNPETSFVLV